MAAALTARSGRLRDRIVLVTGSSSGIGEACVERFAREGAAVVGADLNPPARDLELPDDAEEVAFELLDVRDEGAVEQLVHSIVERYGRLDGVVTAAGVAGGGPLHLVDQLEWDRVLDINLKGTYLTVKHAVAAMLAAPPRADAAGARGSVVTIASVEGLEGTAGGSAYNASKGGVVILTKNVAIDYGRQGIRANCICPGFIDTPMFRGVFGAEPAVPGDSSGDGIEGVRADIEQEHKLRRFGHPSEIAAAALFLLSDDASFVTGVALPVDGGYTAGRDHGVTAMLGL
jgi:NAD(P)-dependent dehydrogenase (short-subunit alcohol dehydrogenase family)